MPEPSARRSASVRAIITGGTQGVGLAIARCLAREGAPAIIISGRNEERGQSAAAELTALGSECRFVRADVAKPEECSRLIEIAIAEIGSINGLVNAAGTAERSGLLNTSLDQWSMHFDVNVRGPFLLMKALVGHLVEEGRPGSIVNIVSKAAYCGSPMVTPYSASKAALANLTKNVANGFADRRIRCNGIMAGWMETPGDDAVQRRFHGQSDGWQSRIGDTLPMGKLAQPDDLAPLVSYLLSPASGVMTGALIDFDQHVVGA